MSRRKKCAPDKHVDRPIRGSKRVVCTVCGDEFPCRQSPCGHVDCHMERGEPLPEGITSSDYIPTKIVLDSASFDRVSEEIRNPSPPNEALKNLFRKSK